MEKYIIDWQTNIFDELSKLTEFENIINGRLGANLVDYKNNLIPIVRTTTIYNKKAQKFLPIHYDIIENIKKITNKNIEFNNALIEIYDSEYRNMKFHSDQALDLVDNSYICIFTCYQNPTYDIRKLKIKNKTTNELSEILMEHNSIILFSTETNKQFMHKIILETTPQHLQLHKNNATTNKFLAITFRLSKTFIQFLNGVPYLYPSSKILRMADSDERKEFTKYKGIENSKICNNYPEINYTISPSDLLPLSDI